MNETLQEFVDSRGVEMRVDRRGGVIRGVKILGVESRNGRTYLAQALAEAARLYEEAKVNVNHPKGNPLAARDYQDRIGVLRRVVARPEEGLFADLHFNPKHALAEQLIWDAEHMPQNVGFSHNVQARTARRGDRVVVEAITKVESVDLVADPATTRGLFESTPDVVEAGSTQSAKDRTENCLAESGSGGSVRSTPPTRESGARVPSDSEEPPKKNFRFSEGDSPIFAARKSGQSPSSSSTDPKQDEQPVVSELTLEDLKQHRPDLVEAVQQEEATELARLRAEIDRLETAEALLTKRLVVRRLLSEFKLPDPDLAEGWAKTVVSERFLESLLAAPGEEAMREMVEERAALVRGANAIRSEAARIDSRPRSRDQSQVYGNGAMDVKAFAQAIT